MRLSEFEEKEFEGPLYNQLEFGSHLLWNPGQVFEQHIGIDRASFIERQAIWDLLGRRRPYGVFLPRYNWGFIWKKRKTKRRLPDFRLNLFIQAKRPWHYPRIPRSLLPFKFYSPAYKIDINSTQQQALERVVLQTI